MELETEVFELTTESYTEPFLVAEDDAGERSAMFLDWDAHLVALAALEAKDADAVVAEEARRMAGADEWLPSSAEAALVAPFETTDEPAFFRKGWSDVDPSTTNYRNPTNSRGATWSRIRLKEDWWQFHDDGTIKSEEGWSRFDHRAFNVSSALFEPVTETRYGQIDLEVVARLLPVLRILGATVQLLEASQGVVRFKYFGPAQYRIGIQAYATGLVREQYPELHNLEFDAIRVMDTWDI
mmetsp:Transcript_2158/g.7682  ORF Transcript_2158/g.7682 Transcript_2158/m.7682 type:complete len:240 (-) Transcript_2158:1-720(-)